MKVIIPAAGLGTRLMPYTSHIPKTMLPVGDQTPITRLLNQLGDNNVKQILIVTGYRHQVLSSFIRSQFPDLDIQIIYNERFAETNNIYSMFLAKEYCDEEILIINSDLLLAAELIETVILEIPDFIVVDKYVKLTDTATKVVITDGLNIAHISKELDPASAQGESIGIVKLSRETARRYFQAVAGFIRREESQVWYPYALNEIFGCIRIRALYTDSLFWCEIDTPQDYERAKERVQCLKNRHPADPKNL